MKKILVSLAVLWCVALGVQAQDNQEYEKQVAKMLEMTHTMDAMKQIFPQMTAMLKQQLPQAPDEFWKELDASMNGMYDKMIKAVIPVYKKYLTLDDLKEIIKFYETPVGKKLSEMNPKATAEILPIAQQIGMQTMQELMQKHYEQLARATITQLRRRGFEAERFATAEEAKAAALRLLPEGCTVAWGGSATIRDMMTFYRGFYPQFSTERYEKLKEVFELDEKRQIRRLSKGMQKQAAFWLALSAMPDYLILDEPVDGLDPVMRRQVWSLMMGDVAERGTTVLVSSHNLRELEDVCDHVGILSHGKVLLERSLTDLQDNILKLQVVFPDGQLPQLPPDLNVLHVTQLGRVHTLIVRGEPAVIKSRVAVFSPMLMEALPLSLEEIFIYELGGEDYAVRDIVL